MGNTMYDYWKRQPEVLRRILDGRKTQTAEFVKLFCEVRPDKLYLVGSGTSLNAENAAMAYMEEIDVYKRQVLLKGMQRGLPPGKSDTINDIIEQNLYNTLSEKAREILCRCV